MKTNPSPCSHRPITPFRALITLFMVGWTVLAPLPTHAQAALAEIPDAVLRLALEKALNKNQGDPISIQEIESLTQLRVDSLYASSDDDDYWVGPRSLTGLEHARNLKILNLDSRGDVLDLSPIGQLTQLEELRIPGNRLLDLEPVAGLTNLVVLEVNNNESDLTDISPVQSLWKLKTLSLEGLGFENIQALAGLTNLVVLDVDKNQIRDISPLQGLTRLKELDLNVNKISDLTPLQGMKDLESLDLDNNSVTDLSVLAGLTKLTELDLTSNFVKDLSPLKDLTSLTNLSVAANDVATILPLSGLNRLQIFHVGGNVLDLTNQSPELALLQSWTNQTNNTITYTPQFVNQPGDAIASARLAAFIRSQFAVSNTTPLTPEILTNLNMQGLYLSGAQYYPYNLRLVETLEGIEYFPNLESVEIREAPQIDLSALSRTHRLNSLRITDTPVTQSETLAALTNLVILELDHVGVTNLTFLKSLPSMYELILRNDRIESLEPVASLTNLQTLRLSHNRIRDISAISNLWKLNRLHVDDNRLTSLTATLGMTNLFDLRARRNEITSMPAWSTVYGITRLELSHNLLSSIDSITNLSALSVLDLDHNGITHFPRTERLQNLGSVDLADNLITNVEPFSLLKGLWDLDLDENRITDIGPLAQIPNLSRLDLHDNLITDFTPILNLATYRYYFRLENNLAGSPLDAATRTAILEKQRQGAVIRYSPQGSLRMSAEWTAQGLVVRWIGSNHAQYKIEMTEDFQTWKPAHVGLIPGVRGEQSYLLTAPASRGFYRLAVAGIRL